MSRLSEHAANRLTRLLDAGRVRSGVTLVVVNTAFTSTFRTWLAKPGAPSKNELLILACDADAGEIWTKEGMPVVTHATDDTWGDLISKRHEILATLCRAGIDAFYSDADAFWLKDPREYCRHCPADLVFSQGTVLPEEACRAWGFVLCTGFFHVRASEQAAEFFGSVAKRVHQCDQSALNLALLEAETAWTLPAAPCGSLLFRGLRWNPEKPDVCIRYYDQPIFGNSEALGLKLCLLPHRLFARLGPADDTTMVAHLLEDKSPEWQQHIAALKGR